MEINGHPQVQHPQLQQRPKTKKRKFSNLIFVAVLALFTLGLIWQQIVINSQSNDIENLKKTQLPQNTFKDYSDCLSGGGTPAYYRKLVSACLGRSTGNGQDSSVAYQVFLKYTVDAMPHLLQRETSKLENNITNKMNASQSLIDFLKFDYWGCQVKGEYEIIKEVPERFALLKYGCIVNGKLQTGSPPYIIAIKLSDGWILISTSKNIDENGRPSCLLVDMFKVSKDLTPECYQNTGYSDGRIDKVEYL